MRTAIALLTVLALTVPAWDGERGRTAANTFSVTRDRDTGDPTVPGSLSWAIAGVNASAPGAVNAITFHLAAGRTIRVTKPLAAMRKPVTVDGWSQSGGAMGVAVEITGGGLDGDGLTFETGGCCLRGVAVNGFGGYGVVLNNGAGTSNTVENCYVGTDLDGTAAGPGNGGGILVRGPGNTIGNPLSCCVIAGNSGDGITITGAAARGVVVQSCFIGVDGTGLAALPNAGHGLAVTGGAGDCTIGGACDLAGNVISGNGRFGVRLSDSDGNRLLSNYIGPAADGVTLMGNGVGGVGVFGRAADNAIGADGFGNVISGNAGKGVLLAGRDVVNNRMGGNLIGTDASGMAAVPNREDGVYLDDASWNTIGGNTEDDRNLISGNEGNEVVIAGDDNLLAAASVGPTKDGTGSFALGKNGVVFAGSRDAAR
jgi:parallel beta-helix repeat protein